MSGKTYRIDNSFERVEAIFDGKHLVLGVGDFGELQREAHTDTPVSAATEVLMFLSSVFLREESPCLSYHGQEEAQQMARLWQTLLHNHWKKKKKNLCCTNWDLVLCFFFLSLFFFDLTEADSRLGTSSRDRKRYRGVTIKLQT